MVSAGPKRWSGLGASFWLAAGWLSLLVFAAMTASWLPLDPNGFDPRNGLLAPTFRHPFGTTKVGEDIFAIAVHGSRVALIVGLCSALVALLVGAPLGLIAGYFRGRVDTVITTLLDAVVAFPTFVLASALVLFVGQSVLTVVLVVGVVTAPLMARVTRTATRTVVDRDFVLASRMAGARHARVMWQELRPNIVVPVLTYAILISGVAILAEGALSFVGLGAPSDKASWGRLIAGGREELQRAWWWSMCPSALFFLTILSVNLINDRLQARWLLGRPLPKSKAQAPRGVAVSARVSAPAVVSPEVPHARPPSDSGPGGDSTGVGLGAMAHVAAARAMLPVGRRSPDSGPGAMPFPPGPRLRIEALTVTLTTPVGPVRILDGIDLSIEPGRVLALVGESGAGKTMLARTILGMLPDGTEVGGRVLLDGTDLAALDPQGRRRKRGREMAVVLQDPQTALDPVMAVGWQIAEPARVHLGLARALAREHALALMASVGIAEPERRFRQYPHQLSGGLRQRVAIALALSCGPQLLIADEPTSALDVTVQAQILALLDRLRRDRHMAVLLITHDLAMAASFADEIAVMYSGRIVERAAANDLFARPKMRYTQALLASAPSLAAGSHQRLLAIPGQPPNPYFRPSGCAFAPRCGFATAQCIESAPPLVVDPCRAGPSSADTGGGGRLVACWHPAGAIDS